MGQCASSYADSGTRRGAYAPPLPGVPLPPKLLSATKKLSVTVPHDKAGGDTMTVELDGELKEIKYPFTNKMVKQIRTKR